MSAFRFIAIALLFFSVESRAEERNSYFRGVTIEAGSAVRESVNCIGCSIVVKGDLHGEAIAVGGDITVSGVVSGDVVAVGGSIHVMNGAQLGADTVAIGGSTTIEGNVVRTKESDVVSLPWMHLPGQLSVGWRGALTLLGFHAVCVLLAVALLRPKRVRNVAAVSNRWLVTGVLGAAVIVVFSEMLELVDDNVGAPAENIELAVIVAFFAIFALGLSGIVLAIGEWFASDSLIKALAIGCVLLVVFELIPYLGFVVMVLGSCWATGAALWSGMGFREPKPPRNKEAPAVLKLTS